MNEGRKFAGAVGGSTPALMRTALEQWFVAAKAPESGWVYEVVVRETEAEIWLVRVQ